MIKKRLLRPIDEYVPLKGVNLLRRFSILAFFPIIAVVLLMGVVISGIAINNMVKSETEHTRIHTMVLTQQSLSKDDFDKNTPLINKTFDAALSNILEYSEEYKRLKVYDSAGTVLWSDKKELIGINFLKSNEELEEALQGEVISKFGFFSKEENIYEVEFGKGIEIYIPIIKDDKVVGVIETYRIPAHLLEDIKMSLIIIWSIGILSGIFIYLSLYWLVKSSHKNQISLEQSIRESKNKLENMIDGLRDGIALMDPDCNILTINKKLADILNISIKDAIGQNVVDIIFKNAKEKMFNACGETCIKNVESEFNFKLFDQTNHLTRLIKVSVFPLMESIAGEMGDGKKKLHAVVLLRDVTKEKEITAELIRAEKLATIGTLFPKISHEIRSPLNAFELGLATLQEKFPTENLIDLLMSAKEKLFMICNDLLAFSRVETEEEPVLVDLNDVIKNAVRFLHETTGQIKYLQLIEEYGDILPVKGISGRLEQLFINIIMNASHAMENLPLSKQILTISTYKENGDTIACVKDTGSGIKLEDHSKIFDPFYTTKEEGKGTGLGMAIVKEIADQHNAAVSFESNEGKGSTFFVRFHGERDAATD